MVDPVSKLYQDAAAKVGAILNRPDPEAPDIRTVDDFDPWDIFPAVFGSYDSRFDDCAIQVLCELRDGGDRQDDLASAMIREMLCVADLCDYGTSPSYCWPTREFKALLPDLIMRWKAYSAQQWGRAE